MYTINRYLTNLTRKFLPGTCVRINDDDDDENLQCVPEWLNLAPALHNLYVTLCDRQTDRRTDPQTEPQHAARCR